MALTLRILFIVLIAAYFVVIFYYLIKKKMNIQYTLGWLGLGILMLIITVFPGIIAFVAGILAIHDETNLVFLVEGTVILMILISITSIISRQNEANRSMIQTIALLEKKVRELEKKEEQKDNSPAQQSKRI
jgi:hypothetical protein